MNQNLLYLLLLLAGFPAGIFLARLCIDEVKLWEKRLILISIMAFIIAVILSFLSLETYYYKVPTIVVLFFIVITNLIIVWKNESRRKTKRKSKR